MNIKVRFENILSVLDLFKRLFINLLILVLSLVILVLFISNAAKKQLLVKPFKISASLQAKGYTPEILTGLFINKIKDIQLTGASLYHDNKIIIPSWENQVDEISVSFDNSFFSEVKSLFIYFGSYHSKYVNGQIVQVDSLLGMQFTIGGYDASANNVGTMDSLLSMMAEDALSYIDPYTLATYYLKSMQFQKCLRVTQSLLNDENPGNDGLAMHIRGLAYLNQGDTVSAKKIFLQALPQINTPWLTYNNLGIIYSQQNCTDSARAMFAKAFALKTGLFPVYLNFGNFLYHQYAMTGNPKQLDSALLNFKKAIDINKKEIKSYLAILPALYDKGNQTEIEEYRSKIIEMEPDNINVYCSIGRMLKEKHLLALKQPYYARAIQLCYGDTSMVRQLDHFFK